MTLAKINNILLVTGGAGFIGSNFVRMAIRNKSQHVVVVDKLTYAGHRLNLQSVEKNSNYEFIQADIRDRVKMESLLNSYQPRAVVNFAAETHVDRSIDSPGNFIQTNIDGTFQLLESARSFYKQLEPKHQKAFRFLHVSTDEVFGSLKAKGKFKENSPYQPNSPYAATKASADHLVRAYHETYQLPSLITNCSNNYGPNQFPEKLIPLIVLNASEGKPLPIYGDGKNVRDWIYVEDHCDGIWKVLQNGRIGQTYNIGANQEHTNIEVLRAICSALEELKPAKRNASLVLKKIPRYDGLVAFVKDRPGHDRRYAIDSTKIRRTLGWTPKHSFKQGIKKTVEWYLMNRSWCEVVQKNNYFRERLGLSDEINKGAI